MKKVKKILALMACGAMLISVSVMGTMAYLSADATITNTFTVGKVSFGEDKDGDGDYTDEGDVRPLDEAAVNEYGVLLKKGGQPVEDADVNPELEARKDANTYKLIPDHTYVKDPTIHIAEESEACYLYVTVDNGIAEIEAETENGGYQNIEAQMEANGWKKLTESTSATEIKYNDLSVYVYEGSQADEGKVTGKEENQGTVDIVIFEEFKIKSSIEAENKGVGASLVKGLESFVLETIDITAYAVQADGFDSAAAAWADTFGNTTSGN